MELFRLQERNQEEFVSAPESAMDCHLARSGRTNSTSSLDAGWAYFSIQEYLRRPRIPCGSPSVRIQQEQRVILHPGRNGNFGDPRRLALLAQHQEVSDRDLAGGIDLGASGLAEDTHLRAGK